MISIAFLHPVHVGLLEELGHFLFLARRIQDVDLWLRDALQRADQFVVLGRPALCGSRRHFRLFDRRRSFLAMADKAAKVAD